MQHLQFKAAPGKNSILINIKCLEDMVSSNNKRKKQIDYEINDKVTILSMAPDKLVGDMRRVPALVIGKSGTRDIFYELLTPFGVLNIKYRASDLEIYYVDIHISDDIKEKKISLREATKLFNNHPIKQADIAKAKCKCKGKVKLLLNQLTAQLDFL